MSASTYSIYVTASDFLPDGYYSDRTACTDTPISFEHNLTQIDAQRIFTSAVNTLSQSLVNSRVIYTDSVGETANVTVFLSTTTAPEVVLTVATLTGGRKQDVVVEGSYEPASPSTNIYRTPECPSTPIAVVAVAISVCPALCIINCLIGALLHRVLVSRSCYRKKQTPTDQPQHLYDEVTLRATGTEIPGSDPSGNRMCDEKIVTLQNQAYAIASV
ncbi:hypothetical protein GBAR_LOCUS14411 [Geodia barretti]|uniref:Uncharacterized protein n=1 Tax=Geodia barretti TaxID=519541 RepID=A0AA35S7H9_GEOBA|nr:hypothetical protein GBAR_LOCUS14411 [Geodia barretti]